MGLCGGWGTPGDTVHLLGRTNAFALKSTLVPSQACLLLSPHRALEHPCTPWDPVLQVHQHLVSLDKAGTGSASLPQNPPRYPCERDVSGFPLPVRDQLPVQEEGWGKVSLSWASSG